MRLSLASSPRRIARLPRAAPVLVRVISGQTRVATGAEDLLAGYGLPVEAADGPQNWIWPEGELWMAGGVVQTDVEVILP